MKSPTRSIVVMCTAALVGGTGGAFIATEASGGGTQTVTAASAPAQVTARDVANTTAGLSAGQIYSQSRAAVAFVTATTSGSGAAGGSLGAQGSPYGDGSGQQGSSAGTATGSGFVVSEDGYIVTNAHVIDGADDVKVKVGDNATLPAKVVGVDQSTDIALLKVSAPKPLTALVLAESDDVQVGDPTYAIGNPYGLDNTLTTGVVSALHRSITSPNGYAINGVLQTDAAINPGNSGGPLLDSQGRVIGVNSQIATSSTSSDGESGGNVGIGFAVPSDTVTRVVKQLRETGTAKHAYLGVATADATSGGDEGTGATVASVTGGGPAADAGLRAGDVITSIGDTAIRNSEVMGTAVDAHQPGEQVTVGYTRDGEQRTAKVTLGTRPATTSQSAAAQTAP